MARKSLFQRVSAEERRADADRHVLERLLQILDESFDRAEAAADVLLTLSSPTDIADRYLQLFGDTLGYTWRSSQSYDRNRQRIAEAIERYSYKGTRLAQTDIITEYGGEIMGVTDMASTLLIVGRQGRLGSADCVIVGPDFYHDGSYLHDIDRTLVDIPEFWEDFEAQRPAGHLWWYRINHQFGGYAEFDGELERHTVQPLHNLYEGLLGRTLINYLPLPHGAVYGFDTVIGEVDWLYLTNTDTDLLGRALINYMPIPHGAVSGFDTAVYSVDWLYLGNTEVGVLGRSLPNTELSIGSGLGIDGNILQGLGNEIDPDVAVIGGNLWAGSVIDTGIAITMGQMDADDAGIHTGFDTQELDEV